MLYNFDANQNNMNEFHQRVADQNIQGIEQRQEEIQNAKNGFIVVLAGIVVGGIVGWLFFGPADSMQTKKEIPVIHRPLVQAKIQPNEPGGMEIGNQDREIYHIVDNTPKKQEEVKVIPAPEMPKVLVENTITAPDNMENLVESIQEDTNLNGIETPLETVADENIKVADSHLATIKTNSQEKIIIPEKIKDIDVKLQSSINSQNKNTNTTKAQPIIQEKNNATTISTAKSVKMAKGTWYTQIIASSSKSSVETLWKQLSTKHAFLKNYPFEIEEISAANGSTLYRLKVGTFKTRKEAETLNAKLKDNQISSIIKQN